MKPFNTEISLEELAKKSPPLTPKRLNELLDWLYRKRDESVVHPHGRWPKVDLHKLAEHSIPFHVETPDLIMVSSDGMRRAREVGAIIEEDAK